MVLISLLITYEVGLFEAVCILNILITVLVQDQCIKTTAVHQ